MRQTLRLSICLTTALLTAPGCATSEPDPSGNTCAKVTAGITDPNAMPDEVIGLLDEHHWGDMHLDFHVARMWDTLNPATQEWAAKQGIKRWTLQEGEPTTGLEFLAMHRLMLQELRARFPDHVDLFAGWTTPPTDPSDPTGMLPATAGDFDPAMVSAIERLDSDLAGFASDDDFARFLQTKRRPTSDDPFGHADDPSAGLHNYLHNRFASPSSPINVGDPAVNLKNQIFWRIHGWIDARWAAYRKAKGLDDATDPTYLQAMADAQKWMDATMARVHQAGSKADDGCEQEPDQIKNIFAE